jgi:hypothetical protein
MRTLYLKLKNARYYLVVMLFLGVVAALVARPLPTLPTSTPNYAFLISNEAPGFFGANGILGTDTDQCTACVASVGVCEGWLESGTGIQTMETAINNACTGLGSSLTTTCNQQLLAGLEEEINWIKTAETPEVVCQQVDSCTPPSPFNLFGNSSLMAAPGTGSTSILQGHRFEAATYEGMLGTRTVDIGSLTANGATLGQHVVYSLTPFPLTSVVVGGVTYQVRAIFYATGIWTGSQTP